MVIRAGDFDGWRACFFAQVVGGTAVVKCGGSSDVEILVEGGGISEHAIQPVNDVVYVNDVAMDGFARSINQNGEVLFTCSGKFQCLFTRISKTMAFLGWIDILQKRKVIQ